MPEATMADMINAKRATAFDGEFEALLRRPLYCPHCKASRTILETSIPVKADGMPACSICGKEGIEPVRGNFAELFRAVLNKLVPFNRAGTA